MFRRILRTLSHAVFPSKCRLCGRLFHSDADGPSQHNFFRLPAEAPVETVFHQSLAPFFCPDCQTDFTPVASPFCTRCGRMFETSHGANHLCGDCIQQPPACRAIRSAGIYRGALKSAIHALKYKNKVHMARPLGKLLFTAFMEYHNFTANAIECIMPVPLHFSRLRQRGFNQAHILIDSWPVFLAQTNSGRDIRIAETNLVRQRKTETQTGLGREKRRQNVKGAFFIADTAGISGKNILLVDDVFTTGATIEECATTLLAAGAASVSALTLARAS
jgi:ComF family protein